ncbi:MAG: hypothetical protein DMD61_01885 [Gemmatimonadetes bacterium]|nr:MAG: hypothetical protein DMD61_01885 [Gemmatimonadota bacterium]
MLKHAIVFLLLVVPAGLRSQSAADARWMAQCRDHEDAWRARACEVRVVSLATGGVITVDPGRNGAAAVEGWDRDTIEVHARIQAEGATDGDAAALARAIKIVASGTTIGEEGPDAGRRQSWSVSFVVYAPRHSDLKLDTYNGPIGVREVSGRMTLTAYNGPISLVGVGGDVRARTKLEFGTVNGPMTVGFPLTVTIQGKVGRRIITKLGAGGAPIRAVTTNGPVEIQRN